MNQFHKIGGALAIVAAAAFSTSTVQAADVDFGVMEFGQEYSYGMFQSFSGEITPKTSGVLNILGASNVELWTDAAHTKGHIQPNYVAYNTYTANVVGGTTYYLYSPKEWDPGVLKLTMAGAGEETLKVSAMWPSEDTYFDLASAGAEYLTIEFNLGVTCSAAYDITYKNLSGTYTTSSYSGAASRGKFIDVPVQANLLSLMNNGKIMPNSPFYIVVKDVKSVSGQKLDRADANGNITFSFMIGSAPTTITNVKYPTPFLSYWIPGDENAKLVVNFSKELTRHPNTTVELQYGDVEVDNGYYVERVPFTINGKTLTADLSGVLRTPTTMLPLTKIEKTYMGIRLGNLVDVDGQTVATGAAGAVGSIFYSPSYVMLERANVVCDFTPANGTSLKGKDKVSIWISGLSTLKFDGFKFATESASVVVPIAEATFEADSDNEGEYTVTIPASMKNQSGVTITLNNLKSADGYDHSADIMASYDTMTVLFAEPANGSEMATLAAGTIINVETNYDATYPEMVVVYDITDLQAENPDEAIIKTEAYMERTPAGHYTAEVFGNYKLLQGHQYRVNFTAYENSDALNYGGESLGSSYIIWNGTTTPFQYSPITLLSIEPAEGTRITKADRNFNLKFDGLVTLDATSTFINRGMGMRESFEAITPVNPSEYEGTDYANEWNLTVPESYMAQLSVPLAISFKPIDQDGKVLRGTNGTEENSFFYYTYEIAETFADFDVYFPDHAETANSVATLWASNEIGILPSYQMAANSAYVMNKSRDIVANVVSFIIPINENGDQFSDELNTEVGLVLDKEITTAGAYILYLPENYFNVGSEYNQQNSMEKYWNFEITGVNTGDIPYELELSVPNESTVESLQTIEIVFADYNEISLGSGMIKVWYNSDTRANTLLETLDAQLDDLQWNKATITLNKAYTEFGTYTIEIPEGYFQLGEIGLPSEAFDLTYYVGQTGIEIISADGANEVFDLMGRRVNAANLSNGLYIVNGKKVLVK